MITEPTTLFIFLVSLLGGVFWLSGLPRLKPLFKVTPVVLYAYFLPTICTTLGITPSSSPAYAWMTKYLLPVSLMLLVVTVDVRAILRLGGKALAMMLVGTAGIVFGGPLAFALFGGFLPEDAWKGFAALSGSWIGGTVNMVAVQASVGASSEIMGPIIVVDTVVGYGWMAILLFFSSWQGRFDRWAGADGSAVESVSRKLSAIDETRRPSELRDLVMIVALAFGAAGFSIWAGNQLPPLGDPTIISHTTWAVVIVTALALGLSFTSVARLEQVGASRMGTLALYLMLTAVGAQANLRAVLDAPLYLAAGVVWIAFHVALLVLAAKLLKAPLFFVATASMANVGGAASAPVVASVYHRALAPVGVLLAVAGYILGTYGGLLCAWLLARVAAG